MEDSFQLFLNPRFSINAPYTDAARDVVSLGALELAWNAAREWPEYAETPFHDLTDLATDLDVAQILLKDESGRFGLGSFKAIGGAYGVLRAVQSELRDRGIEVDGAGLRSGQYQDAMKDYNKAIELDPDHPNNYLGKAILLAETGSRRC